MSRNGIDLYRFIPSGVNVLFFLVSLYLAPFIHEPGHALAARLAGWEVSRVSFGRGRELFRKRIFGILFVFKSVLGVGLTFLGTVKSGFSKAKYFLFVSGGLLMQLAVCGIASLVFNFHFSDFFGGEDANFAAAFIVANLFVVILNLVPRKIAVGFERIPNDGSKLFSLGRMKESDIHSVLASYFLMEFQELYESKKYGEARDKLTECLEEFPDVDAARINYALVLIKLMRLDEAKVIYTELLQGEHNRNYDSLICNNLAWIYLIEFDEESIRMADEYSKKSMDLGPVSGRFGTRGCILIAQGSYDEGINILIRGTKLGSRIDDRSNPAIHFLFLAFGYLKSGNEKKASRCLDKVKGFIDALEPDNKLLFNHLCEKSDYFGGYFQKPA